MTDPFVLAALIFPAVSLVPTFIAVRLCFIRGQAWWWSLPCLVLSWPGVWLSYKYLPT